MERVEVYKYSDCRSGRVQEEMDIIVKYKKGVSDEDGMHLELKLAPSHHHCSLLKDGWCIYIVICKKNIFVRIRGVYYYRKG